MEGKKPRLILIGCGGHGISSLLALKIDELKKRTDFDREMIIIDDVKDIDLTRGVNPEIIKPLPDLQPLYLKHGDYKHNLPSGKKRRKSERKSKKRKKR
jgi:hypothetical protein